MRRSEVKAKIDKSGPQRGKTTRINGCWPEERGIRVKKNACLKEKYGWWFAPRTFTLKKQPEKKGENSR